MLRLFLDRIPLNRVVSKERVKNRDEPMAEWVSLVERTGFPIFAFLLVVWCIIKATKWYGANIALPKAKSDIALLESVRETNSKNSDNQARLIQAQLIQAATLQQLASGQETQTELLRELAGRHMECPMRQKENE